MASAAFTPPKQWEDWCDWALGIWLILSPWILVFHYDPVATRNAVIVGFLVVLAEAVTLTVFRPWEEWINVALGAWLAVSPWALAITNVVVIINFVLVGTLIAGLAFYQVQQLSRERRY